MADLYRKIKSGLGVSNFINLGGNAHPIVNNEFFGVSVSGNATLADFDLSFVFDPQTANGEAIGSVADFSLISNLETQTANGLANVGLTDFNLNFSLDNSTAEGVANSIFNEVNLSYVFANSTALGDSFANSGSWNLSFDLPIFDVNVGATASFGDFSLIFDTEINGGGTANVNFITKNSFFTLAGLSAGGVLEREIFFANSYFCGTANFRSEIENQVEENSIFRFNYIFKSKIK
jgi:hypothetical protein